MYLCHVGKAPSRNKKSVELKALVIIERWLDSNECRCGLRLRYFSRVVSIGNRSCLRQASSSRTPHRTRLGGLFVVYLPQTHEKTAPRQLSAVHALGSEIGVHRPMVPEGRSFR